MKKAIFVIFLLCVATFAQIPSAAHIQILKAEDALNFDGLKPFLFSKNLSIQERAVLAAGRIGERSSVDALAGILENGDAKVRPMAAFALGETEADHAATFVLRALKSDTLTPALTARLVEAAGKIAAANPKDEKSKELGKAILDTLDKATDRETILLGLTALLRARPDGTDVAAAKFLTHADPRVRADAANTLARVRAKNANEALRKIALHDTDENARANAIRALGAAEDKEAFNLLLEAATGDKSPNIRIAAIRSLASLKDVKASDRLTALGEKLLGEITKTRKPNFLPAEQSEFAELAVTLGRLLANTDNQRADKLFADFGKIDKGHTPEAYIARVRIGPKRGDGTSPELTSWRQYSTLAQIVGEFAAIEPTSEVGKQMKAEAPGIFRPLAKAFASADPDAEAATILAAPDVLRAFARFKTDDLGEVLREALKNKDIFVRAVAADLMADLPASPENIAALRSAFEYARVNDVKYNDAILAIVVGLIKLDRVGSMETWAQALISPDHLVRRRVRDEIPDDIKKITSKELLFQVNEPLGPGTRMGQVLNKDADYRRAITRKNGNVKAVLTTQKGTFTIDLLPEDAPLTVDNFIKLAKSNYFNGLEVHRVVPNFVMQDGDPRGDGNGGPGWSIRCEINMVPFERGTVGMALSGKDTGGSQWFAAHSPQPHLDGGYTVFGKVNETGMKVVDTIVRGDKIISVKIIEGGLPQRTQRARRK